MPNEEMDLPLPRAVARQLLLGRRESLTIAGELGVLVAAVNTALLRLRELCSGCITLLQPYAGEPRFSSRRGVGDAEAHGVDGGR